MKYILTTSKLSFLRFFILPFSLWSKTKVARLNTVSQRQAADLSNEHIALITTTSGTTGEPKIAHRSVGFLKTQFETIQDILKLESTDIHLSSFPIVLLCNLLVGAASVILPSKKHEEFVQGLDGVTFPTIISASPFYIQSLLAKLDFNMVNSLIIGGASLFKPLASQLLPYEHKTKLIYGSTEVEPLTTAPLAEFYLADRSQKGIFVGKVHKNLNMKIIDAIGGIGELVVAGKHVLPKEYLENGDHLYISLEGKEFYKTGDLVYLEGENLFFYGRKKFSWLYENEIYSPVLCEKWNAKKGIYREATMLVVDHKNTVFYSGSKDMEVEFKKQAPFTVHAFKRLKELPKDKRHRSRVEYQLLLK